MADKETGLNIPIGAYADEKSAEAAVKNISKKVDSSLKDGRIEIPIELKAPIKGASEELLKAQKDVIKKLEATSKKGFSSSSKEADALIKSYTNFKKLVGQAHKNNMTQIKDLSTIISKKVQSLKLEKNMTREQQKANSAKAVNVKKSAKDKYLNKQEEYSKRAQGAGKRTELRKELAEVQENKSHIKSNNIRPSTTNDDLVRLSEYSAHGSNWARELAKTLKEETAKAAKTLVTYIDPSLAKKVKSGNTTTEKEFLTDTLKNVKAQLKNSIAQLEAGSEDITLDTLKEQAAVIKVLNNALGKTTEQAEKAITNAIQSRYSDNRNKRLNSTGLEPGQEKGVGPGHENTQKLVSNLYNVMKQWDDEVIADTIAKEMVLGIEKAEKKRSKKRSDSQATAKVSDIKSSDTYKTELAKLSRTTSDTFNAIKESTKSTEKQTNLDKIENVREAVADSKEQSIETVNRDINKDTAGAVKEDVGTGFNTDSKADELIHTMEKENEIKLPDDIVSILKSILSQLIIITTPQEAKHYKVSRKNSTESSDEKNLFESIQNALVPLQNSVKSSTETPKAVSKSEFDKISTKLAKEEDSAKVQKSTIYASPLRQGFWKSLEDTFRSLTGTTKEYEKVLKANADNQDMLAAERVKTYGLNNGRNPNDTGDIAGMRRILQLYRTNKASIDQNPELMQKIKLTPGRDVDTTELTKALNDALSGKQMQNAQTGGGFLKNALGFMTGGLGYAFMPSLEKSRAQADGLNQMFGNLNKVLQSVLVNIQTKETELAGMQKSGQAKFDKNGFLTSDSTSAAFKTLADLEEEKLVLDTIKADLLANDEIIKRTGGRFSALVKHLNFTSPVLKENNGILRNINAGLDKNGKALKFQTRLAEILNYTYQLMSRSIGQMIKNWLTMLNPINWIKKAFSDFGSYDVKWQRTMNVVKYNLRDVIKPIMEQIAQLLVNMIGFADIILQKVQAAFGSVPISLFDQENAKKFKDEVEEINSITASFDELHDIGQTSEKDPNNLLGDIYKPQLSKEWEDLANRIGDLFAGIIKGDLGFSDVMKEILGILGQTLALIGGMIWDWFKDTAIGKWIIEHWKGLLATLLALFTGWQLLKIFGPTLLSTIGGAFKTLLGKVGGWITTLLGASGFGQGIMTAFQSLFAGGKYSLIGTLGEMFTNSAAITQAGSWGSMIGFALVKGLVGILSIALGGKMVMDAFDSAADKTSYNIGLEQAGGKEEDKKGTGWDIAKSAAGGAAIGFGIGQIIPVVGPLVGAAIGAVAGALTTALAPAFEKAEVSARNMNNEMQKIEHYEGIVQGAKTQVDELDELMNMSNDTVKAQSDKVYELGEKYGVSKWRLDELIQAMKDGNYNTEMATGLNSELVTALGQLDWHYQNNAGLTDKLTEAKKNLQKAELDLAIAQDIEAGNFEIAVARMEYAMASGLYETDEAAKKMSQIMKETSFTESKELLNNVSPELKAKWEEYVTDVDQGKKDMAEIFKKMSDSERTLLLNSNDNALKQKWFTYATTTEDGKKQLAKIYAEMNEEERKAFTQDYSSEAGGAIGKAIDAMQAEINSATFDWSHPFKSLGSMFTGNWDWKAKYASFDVGTNYVPNDGFAYIHKGEAIIPKDENVFARQGKAWDGQMTMNSQMMSAITRLEQTISQGINVRGEFKQRGNDLVATVEKAKNKNGNQPLNNSVFAR